MPYDKHCDDKSARVLAMMVAANGRVDARELRALDSLGAFARIGISRAAFVAMAHQCVEEFGHDFAHCPWLRLTDRVYIDRLIDDIDDPQQRLLLGRLAAAVITADGRVSTDERMVYEHVLGRWHLSPSMVTQAILHDAMRPTRGGPRTRVQAAP